jgi:hypothetical protein
LSYSASDQEDLDLRPAWAKKLVRHGGLCLWSQLCGRL